MANTKKIKTFGQEKNIKLLLLAVIAIGVGGIGLYTLNASHASSQGYLGFANYTTANNDNSTVFTTQDSLAGIGTQSVTDIAPGGKLVYSGVFVGKVAISSVCYNARVYNSPKATNSVTAASVTFVGDHRLITATLPADDHYHEVCVPTGKRKVQDEFNVVNNSPSAFILVERATIHY